MRIRTFLLQNVALATSYVLKQSPSSRNAPCFLNSRGILPSLHHQVTAGPKRRSPPGVCWFTTSSGDSSSSTTTSSRNNNNNKQAQSSGPRPLRGWVQDSDGEWQWEEDDPTYVAPTTTTTAPKATTTTTPINAVATPQLPSGVYRPKKSLGQNYLKDPNTVVKILKSFHQDATHKGQRPSIDRVIELGPGAGALTDRLVELYGTDVVQCIELDERSIDLLRQKHSGLRVTHADILQVDYPALAEQEGKALVVIGNLPYYITSQILFALADASHFGAVDTATVTMQWEVGQRMVAPIRTKVRTIIHSNCNYFIILTPISHGDILNV